MAIKGLTPQLAERGKLKIGGLGEERKKQGSNETYRLPVKYDHIVITTMQRDQAGRLMQDKELMDRLMQAQGVQKLTEIPVRLLYDDIDLNFPTRYSCYKGNRCWCTGDGERAQRFGEGRIEDNTVSPGFRQAGPNEYGEVPCPCERGEPTYDKADKCKPMGTLQVLLEGVDRVGGVWKLRTTSWNTVNAILSSLVLVKTITGGPLAGIPLHLVLSPKTVTVPTTGKNMVVYVCSLEYRGPEEKLAELGYDIAKRRIEHRIKMEHVEEEARRLLVAPHQEPTEEQRATAEEYYPETGGLDLDQQPTGPYVPPGLNTAPAGDGSPKKPKVTMAPPAQETKRQEPQAVTLPELMEICHKGQDLTMPLAIRSHKPGVENLGVLKSWERDPGTGKYSLMIDLAPNLKELADGLTPEMIVKSFGDAGISITPASESVAARIAQPETKAPAVTGSCDFHPDQPATWRDEQGFLRCTGCPGKNAHPEEVPPGFEGVTTSSPPNSFAPADNGSRKTHGARKSLF